MSLRGKQANGLVTQQRVLRAAVAQFLEKGYTGTTTADITGAAGIAQSSFFHVFPSKEALLLELVRRMVVSYNRDNSGEKPLRRKALRACRIGAPVRCRRGQYGTTPFLQTG